MYKKILVGYDGSEHSKKALAHAVELAKAHNASLYIITVAQLASRGGELPASALEELEKWGRLKAAEAKRIAAGEGVQATEAAVRLGHPVDEILIYAEEIGADLIVVGSRGLSTVKRILLGSVSSGVVTHARTSVLVVR